MSKFLGRHTGPLPSRPFSINLKKTSATWLNKWHFRWTIPQFPRLCTRSILQRETSLPFPKPTESVVAVTSRSTTPQNLAPQIIWATLPSLPLHKCTKTPCLPSSLPPSLSTSEPAICKQIQAPGPQTSLRAGPGPRLDLKEHSLSQVRSYWAKLKSITKINGSQRSSFRYVA
jgi:hypothetical protein